MEAKELFGGAAANGMLLLLLDDADLAAAAAAALASASASSRWISKRDFVGVTVLTTGLPQDEVTVSDFEASVTNFLTSFFSVLGLVKRVLEAGALADLTSALAASLASARASCIDDGVEVGTVATGADT
ncbi:hypothetical protein WICPIJ_007370 [Wickerhamomyces pijperi]|uniref:Uncharacterized protein n=1 Tax=Wickerhamomyces pijperi TaxID=599730 RepID=A0A9P8Q2P2_WICPI|nr:hypothetical protein WICPIJ_007370 [Wickerhamomyces pijperi]